MQQQLELDAPLMTVARTRGADAAQAAMGKAERVDGLDRTGAARLIHSWLVRHGPTSGEQLVKQAVSHGFYVTNRRSYGQVFKDLLAASRVVVLRSDLPREHGNGTSGGKLYAAVRT